MISSPRATSSSSLASYRGLTTSSTSSRCRLGRNPPLATTSYLQLARPISSLVALLLSSPSSPTYQAPPSISFPPPTSPPTHPSLQPMLYHVVYLLSLQVPPLLRPTTQLPARLPAATNNLTDPDPWTSPLQLQGVQIQGVPIRGHHVGRHSKALRTTSKFPSRAGF